MGRSEVAARALREGSTMQGHSRSQADMASEFLFRGGASGNGRESIDSPRGSKDSFTAKGLKSALASSRSANDMQHIHKVHSVAAFGEARAESGGDSCGGVLAALTAHVCLHRARTHMRPPRPPAALASFGRDFWIASYWIRGAALRRRR